MKAIGFGIEGETPMTCALDEIRVIIDALLRIEGDITKTELLTLARTKVAFCVHLNDETQP